MKNYLVFYLFKPNHAPWKSALRPEYVRFNEFSSKSFKKNLVGLDEIIVFDDEVDRLTDGFKLGFEKIYDLWKSEKCNILFCGVDTYCFKKVEIFDKFENFMMFNYTDPSTYADISEYFNCDVRLYPHTMKQEVWDVGLEMVDNWDSSQPWDYEQYIYNKMLWSQGLSFEQVYHPQLAWQDCRVKNNNNGLSVSDAQIVHFHGTRQIDTLYNKVVELTG